MFSQKQIDMSAFEMVRFWLIMIGWWEIDDFDPADPACVRNSGTHRLYTVSVRIEEQFSPVLIEILKRDFMQHTISHNGCSLPALQFQFYDMTVYNRAQGATLYVTIYQ